MFDTLTPLGRGQALLVTGPPTSGLTQVVLDTVLNQHGSDVHVVYGTIGLPRVMMTTLHKLLASRGAMDHTTVVWAADDASLAEKYAAC